MVSFLCLNPSSLFGIPNEPEDGSESDTDLFKIRTFFLFWPYLANPIYRPPNVILLMKRSFRPLISILMLVALTATLSCRIASPRRGVFTVSAELESTTVLIQPPQIQVFNSTLLKFASIDIGEAKSKLEIKQLLERDFPNQGRQRNFATSRSFSHHDAKSKNSNGLPVLLRAPKFYRYWLDFRRNLQLWARKKTFQPDIMMDLVSLVKTPIDRHNGLMSSARKYKSCAIVGNSGILLNRDYGELIDGHEIVIRLNNARTEKREGCFCHPYGRNVPMIMYICQLVHFMDYTVCNSSHKAPLLITDPRFDVLCARIVKYYSAKRFLEETRKALLLYNLRINETPIRLELITHSENFVFTFEEWASTHDGSMFHYSSGMQAVMLPLGICDKVGIFGFGKSTSAKHHYHTNQKSELRLHDYEAEYAFYHDLVKNPQAIPFISDRFRFPPVVIYL
ncbi:hypothetical protein ES319_D05G084200v1 [Gossypium barbadense]|uniref:Uncharacterized protein n=1 Tax=Gossypium barbadense TaxID=3634 RepID=A0A5J5RB73_GOSBA|nr:hypothetical protein ES319_D05G084200v1 [Gossypium barbadense]